MRYAATFLLLSALAGARLEAAVDEAKLLAEVRPDELKRQAEPIVKEVRPSGSPGEIAAIDAIVKTLRADGIPVEVYKFSAYVSDPVRASFAIESPEPKEFPALTQAFSASTPPSGVSGTIVDVGNGAPADYAKVKSAVRGKLVLANGLADPDGVQAAQNAGAIGAVFTATADRVNEMTVGPVWGTPDPDDAKLLPRIPSVAISKEAGVEIRRRLTAGAVKAHLATEVSSGFKPLQLAVATIRSPRDPQGYALLGGHIDAWHHGGTDEGASNAAMVEVARIFYRHRDELEHGLVVAWWPGHSNGRYAGSTWYTDHFWIDLKDNALAYLNIDGVGQKEASLFSVAATSELEPLARAVVRGQTGVDPEVSRPGRNSDESFYGIGVPLLQFNHERAAAIGGYWWWHTPDDTFDKIDFDVLAVDTKLYVAALYRLLATPAPPYALSAAAAEIEGLLQQRSARAAEAHIDLAPALERASRLRHLAESLDERLKRDRGPLDPTELSRRLVRILRPLTRLMYQQRGPYRQDLALEGPRLPGLGALAGATPVKLDGFTEAQLVRESNRVVDHLDQALAEAEALAGELTSTPGER
jgi:Iap family predicted aminopeptidase